MDKKFGHRPRFCLAPTSRHQFHRLPIFPVPPCSLLPPPARPRPLIVQLSANTTQFQQRVAFPFWQAEIGVEQYRFVELCSRSLPRSPVTPTESRTRRVHDCCTLDFCSDSSLTHTLALNHLYFLRSERRAWTWTSNSILTGPVLNQRGHRLTLPHLFQQTRTLYPHKPALATRSTHHSHPLPFSLHPFLRLHFLMDRV